MSVFCCRRRYRRNKLLALLFSTVFVLQLVLYPLVYSNNPGKAGQSSYVPFSLFEETYIINDFTGSELLNYIELNHILGRNTRDFGRLFYLFMDINLLPFISINLYLIYVVFRFIRRRRQGSVLADFLGGHAPPEIILY